MKNAIKNNDIIKTFLDMQRDTMFSRQIPLDFARLIYSESEPSPFWNYAFTDKILSDAEISIIEEKLISVQRKPMVYFEVKENIEPLRAHLAEKGYIFFSEDSWMFFDPSAKIDTKNNARFDCIRRVENENDLTTWLATADRCYVADDAQNPYGPLGKDYLILAESAWKENHANDAFDYFLAYKDKEPVAVGTLTYQNDMGYISNIASLPSIRGQGYGKTVTLYCVHRSQMFDAREIFLATEEGTYPNAFYKKIGFKTRFTGTGYVKK
jgi:N-acetylglutamate synthase-like GNAT family acetyltransferase